MTTVIIKTPADFVGSVVGASEANTKAILDNAIGKVLVIDEAYGLYGRPNITDPYRIAVIDTIVAEVQSVPGDDRCVLLLGYTEQMQEMMQNVNPGLTRRFPLDSAFVFEDFTGQEMGVILDAKLKAQGYKVTAKARSIAMEMLSRARNRPHFGNAGEIDILLNKAKIAQQGRFTRDKTPPSAILEAQDFDADYERSERAVTNVAKLFEGVVGCQDIVAQLQGYQTIVANLRQLDQDPRAELPFNFLFRGPPGTGKTSTARKMGKVYYDMGFLADAKVVECSAKDLVGEYVGHTGPKTQKLVERALGSILFIDEAYRLAEGPFAKEAVDELVDCVTKTQFQNKLVIILAGYEHDINRLMSINPGLTSRFPEVIDFQSLSPEDCYGLLHSRVAGRKKIDASVLGSPTPDFRNKVTALFAVLSSLSNFANGRDVETLAKAIVSDIMKRPMRPNGTLAVTEDLVVREIQKMIAERTSRASAARPATQDAVPGAPQPPVAKTGNDQPPRLPTASTTEAKPATAQDSSAEAFKVAGSDDSDDDDPNGPKPTPNAVRDAGVSDEVWEQLQKDKLKAEEEEKERQRLKEEEEELKQWLAKCAAAERQHEEDEAERQRLLEIERKKRELEEIERRRKELEYRKQQEAKAKAKLKRMGRCPAGYEWIRQAGGYRCAGGSHWMPNGALNGL